jgi:hypothetical protein
MERVAKATTEDLLERVTVYRDGMEAAALDVIETELRRRGVNYAEQSAFGTAQEKVVLRAPDGSPVRCRQCPRAAVGRRWGWRKWLGVVPLYCKLFPYCERHLPDGRGKMLPPPRAT